MTTKYSFTDLTNDYFKLKSVCPTYRFGQFFLTVVDIVERNHPLWNYDYATANQTICDTIEYYEWDYNDLPVNHKYLKELFDENLK